MVWTLLLKTPPKETTLNTLGQDWSEGDNNVSVYIKKLRGEIGRFCKRNESLNAEAGARIQNLISTYLDDSAGKDYYPALVSLCAPFVYVFASQSLAKDAFCRLMGRMDDWLSAHSLDEQISNFMVLFRVLIPELHNHFEEEQVDLREEGGIRSWFESLLCKQLGVENVLRVWDFYFAVNSLSMHIFICLAILFHTKEDLEELEQSEIHSFLNRLPQHFNLDALFVTAKQLAYEAETHGIFLQRVVY